MPLPEIAPPKHFPYCVVWTPIPVLTWVFPFIGHVGVCLSSGIILDFAGPYYVAVDTLAFGNPTKYLRLDPALAALSENEPTSPTRSQSAAWDKALQGSTSAFQLKTYSILSQNCHNFVGHFLNRIQYNNKQWDVVAVATAVFLEGQYVDLKACTKTWLPHIALVALGVYFGHLTFLFCYVIFIVAPAAWLVHKNKQAITLLAAVTSPLDIGVRLV